MPKTVTYICDKCHTAYSNGHELASFTLNIQPVVTYIVKGIEPLRLRKVSINADRSVIWCRECLAKADLLCTEENGGASIPLGDQLITLIEDIAYEAAENN